MSKILTGTTVATIMTDTVIVEVTRRTPHPLYKKLMKRTKRFKVATNGKKITIGSIVKIVETKPMSKDKHFRLMDKKEDKEK